MSTKALTTDNLDSGAKRAAYQAIDSMHIAYYERGGLRDTVDKLREKLEDVSEKVSQHIYRLALYASKHAPTPSKQLALFLAMCEYAEQRYKEERQITNMKDPDNGLPVWPVYKSNILGGFKLKVPPVEYRTEYEYRKAVQALRAGKQDTKSITGPRSKSKHVTVEQAQDWLGDTGVFPSLQGQLASLIYTAEKIKRAQAPEAERIIGKAMEQLSMLV